MIQSDEDGTPADVAREAGRKREAATCDECGARVVNTASCLSGDPTLCEMCDLSAWAAGMSSACGEYSVLPQAQKKCPDQHLCEDCDRDRFVAARSRASFMCSPEMRILPKGF